MAMEDEAGAMTSRRAFLGTGLLGGVLAAAAAPLLGGEVAGAVGEAPAANEPASARRAAGDQAAGAADGFELEEATVAEVQAALAAGRQTPRGLVAAYPARIPGLERSRPRRRARLQGNPEALPTARPPAAD